MGSTVREALESAISTVEARESSITAAPEVTAEPIEPIQQVEASPAEGETEAQRSQRLRDEKGRFVEGKAEAPQAKPAEVAPAPVVARPPRPSSWKKDYWEHWDKLDPKLAEYINQREGEYAKGVSTYKSEWDNAKPLIDAVAPFLPELQKHNIKPDQWISNLGRAHHTLATADNQSKLQMFAKLAQDYQVPLQALYDPQFAQQFVSQSLQQPRQQPAPQQDINALVDQAIDARRNQDAIQQFREAKDAAGNLLNPHFEMVKSDMVLLLGAGKAQDLPSAYSMALRLHDDLFQAEQDKKRKADEASRLEAQRKAVAAAKGSAVSVKSATPAVAGSAPKKGIRSQLEDAYDQHASGRV